MFGVAMSPGFSLLEHLFKKYQMWRVQNSADLPPQEDWNAAYMKSQFTLNTR